MRKITNDPVFMITLMFAIVQILGLSAGVLLLSAASSDEQVRAISISPMQNANDPLNALFYLGYILFGAAFALFLIKFIKFKFSFRLLELAMVAGSVSVLIFAFLYHLMGANFLSSLLLSIILGATFSIAKFFFSKLKNMAAILSSAGVGALFGYSMGFIPAIIFIIGISLYDYIAVFKTKHMLTLAQNLGSKDMSFTVTARMHNHMPTKKVDKTAQDNSRITNVSAKKIAKTTIDVSAKKHMREQSSRFERIDLGSGDLAVPVMLAVSTYQATGLFGSLAIVIGTTFSIYHLLKFVERRHVILPALPPISLGGLLALIIIMIIQAIL